MGARELLADLTRDGFTIAADADQLVIRPASKLTDELRATLRAAKPELLAILTTPANASRTCRDCTNPARYGNCRKPVEAGLLPAGATFAILWAPEGHAATCPAFEAKASAKAPDRPYRLTPAEGDAAHAEAWGDAAIARFVARVALLMRRGFNATDADDLAERLHLRDATGDDRRLCVECSHLRGRPGAWACGNHRAADVGPDLPDAMATTMQRCAGFDTALNATREPSANRREPPRGDV